MAKQTFAHYQIALSSQTTNILVAKIIDVDEQKINKIFKIKYQLKRPEESLAEAIKNDQERFDEFVLWLDKKVNIML